MSTPQLNPGGYRESSVMANLDGLSGKILLVHGMVDEPFELLGENTAPNPQEYLMTALNACVMVGYVAGAAIRGIRLESLELVTEGALDLRGFLGIDPTVKPGYDRIRYTVRIKGNGTAEQFREIHETVLKTSPNYFNVSQPVAIDADLVVIR